MNCTNCAVSAKGLTKRFGDFTAVDGIDLEIRAGEIFGFLGPNGAGKSTTIKMLCGLLLPSSGEGTVGGFDIRTQSEEIKKNIGYMSQKFSLYDELTVVENLDFFSGIYGVPRAKKKERLEKILETSGLAESGNRQVMTLPGGFRQRLALGCAVLHEPRIIFLDEPTSGVDPISRRNFWSLIDEMSRNGSTVFVTTHYMDEAEYCGRLALIYRGAIAAQGSPDELKRKHMRKHVLEIRSERTVEAFEALSKAAMNAAIFGNTIHAVVDDEASAAEKISVILGEAEIALHGIERIVPSLEDVFTALVEES